MSEDHLERARELADTPSTLPAHGILHAVIALVEEVRELRLVLTEQKQG